MPTDTTNLMEKVYDLISGIYSSTTGDASFLAFDVGVPLSAGMFKLDPQSAPSPALAVERLSEICNAVLQVEGDSVTRSIRTVDTMAELMLTQAMPVSTDAMTGLGAARNAASQAFDNTVGSLEGAFQFHPVYASPVDWYVPESNGNWTLHTVAQQDGPPPATPVTAPPRPVPVNPPTWHVAPAGLQPTLSQPFTMTHPLLAGAQLRPNGQAIAPAHPQVMTMRPMMTMMPAQAAVRPQVAPSPMVVSRAPQPAPVPPTKAPLTLLQASVQLHAMTTPQPVTTDSLAISFEHCIVTLTRPWFPEVFLMLRNWYVPDYKLGAFSNATGAGDTGLFPVLANAFVVIRNLSISAKWSSQDLAAAQGSAAFGPFSLVGRSYDAASGTLTCPGMQIIGWFCGALPVLPPASDPSLAAARPAPATSTANSSAAGASASGSSLPNQAGGTTP